MSRKLTNKEILRKDVKSNNTAEYVNLDLEFVDTQIVNFFKNKNLQVKDEVDGKLKKVEWIFATPERWALMREGKDDKFNKIIRNTVTPIISIRRTSIERDPNRNTGDVYNIILNKKWAKRNQYLSRNIDAFLNKKYYNQYEIKYVRIPGFMKIGYTFTLLAGKMVHLNKLTEFFLEFDDCEAIKTNKGELQIHFDEGFSDTSNVEDFSEDQRRFSSEYNVNVITQIIPEETENKETKIQKLLTPISITTTETVY